MDDRLLELMAAYDAAPVGSEDRVRLGSELDREGSRKVRTERDFWRVVYAYRERGGLKGKA